MEFMDLIEIPRVDNIKLTTQVLNEHGNQLNHETYEGSLCLTSHHTIFSCKKKEADKNQEIWILHSLIDSIEQKLRENKFQMIIKCKNFQFYYVDFPSPSYCQSISKSLDGLSNLTSDNMKFPFFNRINLKMVKSDWNLYSIEDEFNNYFKMSNNNSNNEWRISEANINYSICSTYPPKVIVPANIQDSDIIKSAQFRAGGRFPILSYFHKLKNSFLLRSSQPLLGANNRRCKEDESLLKTSLPMGKQGYVYDLRDASILKSAASKGGGYETEANYPLWKRINKHLDRFDQLHSSFSKLMDACTDQNITIEKYLNKLESSNWFFNIRQAIYVACIIADELHNKNGCVLVHGWDGTDNTLLICSLVQIILNPDCRTLKGFQRLIEKEWLRAGHPFAKRCFKLAFGSTSQKQEGPVFLLFLDCIRQIMRQFCLSFEFNEDFLILIFDNVYASEYGTFLGNCHREREELFLSTRTVSLWTYANSSENVKNYLNPLYEINDAAIWPSTFSQCVTLWSSLYLRYQKSDAPLKEAKTESIRIVEMNKQAKERAEKLKKEFAGLIEQANSQGIFT